MPLQPVEAAWILVEIALYAAFFALLHCAARLPMLSLFPRDQLVRLDGSDILYIPEK